MALGLGHQYSVRVIKYIYGNLGAILSFMIKEDEGREDRWFEVWPQVDTKTGGWYHKSYEMEEKK